MSILGYLWPTRERIVEGRCEIGPPLARMRQEPGW